MSHELRWAEWDGYEAAQLDELVGRGAVHTEDLGGSIMLILNTDDGKRVHLSIGLRRLPRSEWWDEIKMAWYDRRLPCFWELAQRLVEVT